MDGSGEGWGWLGCILKLQDVLSQELLRAPEETVILQLSRPEGFRLRPLKGYPLVMSPPCKVLRTFPDQFCDRPR